MAELLLAGLFLIFVGFTVHSSWYHYTVNVIAGVTGIVLVAFGFCALVYGELRRTKAEVKMARETALKH